MSAAGHTLPAGYSLALWEDGRYRVHAVTGWRGHAVRPLANSLNRDGYAYVRVTNNGRRTKRFIHKLVCFAVHGSPPTVRHEVRHLDGNKSNNLPENLSWGTRKENADDRELHGRTSRGANHSASIKAGLAGGVP